MTRLHASVMIRHRVQIVDVLRVGAVVLFSSSDVRQHVHVGERKIDVDGLLSECRVHVGLSVEAFEVNDEDRWQLWYVKLFNCFTRQLAEWTIPSDHHLSMEIHIEAIGDVTSVDVVWRKLETQIWERLVGGTFTWANRALDGALDLAVEQSQNEALLGFRVLQPGLFRRNWLDGVLLMKSNWRLD